MEKRGSDNNGGLWQNTTRQTSHRMWHDAGSQETHNEERGPTMEFVHRDRSIEEYQICDWHGSVAACPGLRGRNRLLAVLIMGIVGIFRDAGLLSSCCDTLQGCD